MTTVFGSRDTFAMVIGSPAWPIRTVEVWVCGKNISLFDSSAYLPSFSHSVARTERWLKEQLNFLKHEGLFVELGIQEAFALVASQEQPGPGIWSDLRLFDWGPTTDDYLCFLLPIRGRLYLACRCNESGSIEGVQIYPYDLISALSSSRRELSRNEPQLPFQALPDDRVAGSF